MQTTSSRGSKLRVTAFVLDIIMLLYFAAYLYWMFGGASMDSDPLPGLFVTVNPMTWGAYLLGAAALVHLAAFRNIAGRCLMIVPYFLAILFSLVAVMGATGWKDMAMYLPHFVIIFIGIAIIKKQYKEKH